MTRFVAALLMAVGGLIAATSGLCSLWFVGNIFFTYSGAPDQIGIVTSALPYVAGYGGIPFIIGLAVFIAGFGLRREQRGFEGKEGP